MARSGEAILATGVSEPVLQDVLDSPDATRKVIRGSALRSVVYLLTVFANLCALPFLFRHLGVENSGRYVTVLTVTTLVGAIVETGFGAISLREYARRDAGERSLLMGDLIAIRGGALVVSGIVALLFLLAAGYPAVIVVGSAVGIAGALFEALSSTYAVALNTGLRLGWMAGLQIIRQSAAVVLTLGLIVLNAPLFAFFIALALAGTAQLASGIYATRDLISHLPSLSWTRTRALLGQSAAFIVAMALSVLYFRLAMILMPVLSSETQTGYLGIPFRVLEIVTLISVLVLSSAFPIIARAAERDRARHRYALQQLTDVSILVGLFVGVMAFVGAPLIVAVLGGEEFQPAGPLMRILAVSLVVKFVVAAWAFALLSLDRHAAVLRASIAATVVALVLTLALVPMMDATGGAIATAVADLTLLLGYGVALLHTEDPVAFSWRRVAVLLAAAAAAISVALVPVPVPAQMVSAAVVYGVVLWKGRLVPRELLEALPLPTGAR